MENRPDLSIASEQEKGAFIVTLYGVIESLRLQINQQAEEVEKLKGQIKNSAASEPSFKESRVVSILLLMLLKPISHISSN